MNEEKEEEKEVFGRMMDLFMNPVFKKDFFDFFLKMQKEGIDAAKKFWDMTSGKNMMFPNVPEIYEKMIDFYITLGFVPRSKYDQALKEIDALAKENRFLRDTIGELQSGIFREGGEKMRENWRAIIDKQIDANKEIAKNFFDLIRQLQGGGR